MRDIRIDRLAHLLTHYSLEAKKGQYAVLSGDVEALPLMEACFEKLTQAGVFVETFITPSAWSETRLREGSDALLKKTPPALLHAVMNCDLYLGIGAESNTKLLANISPEKQTLVSKARKPIIDALLNRAAKKEVRWAYTHFPTPSAAQEAEMGTREYEEMVFSLGALDHKDPIEYWKTIEKEQLKLIDFLSTKHKLRFQNSQGTDLEVNVSGMKWVNCCGKINFPDGEVYTGPNLLAEDGGVNGVAKFSFPTLFRNTEVRDIELYFKNGAVVDAKASKGEAFLKEMINQDEGAKYVGEIAIGTNANMKNITKNILFDEKFGGTFHLALGKGYPQTGNNNESALHWDMIFDLREGGSITADDACFYRDGKVLDEEVGVKR
ncbi:MAG: aminopeptidase [Waddliaceae bacterium]